MKISGIAVLYILLVAVPGIGQELIQGEFPSSSWTARSAHGHAAFAGGQYADALANFQSSLPIASGPEERAITLSDIGYTLIELNRAAEALAQLEQALALWRSINTGGDRTLQVAITVGILQRTLGRFREAEQTLRAAADSASRGNSGSAVALAAFGDLLIEQDRFIEACQMFEKALKLSPGRDQTRASALIGLGYAESNGGRSQPGIGHLREALALSEEIKSPELEALALRDLGNTYAQMGDFVSAQVMLRRALAILETTPVTRIQYAAALVSLGLIYGAENKYVLAEDLFVRALKMYDDKAADPRSAVALQNMAMIRVQQKRFAEAADFANRAYTGLKSAYGENSAPAANALGTLAFVEEREGDLQRSERDYSSALRILRDDRVLASNSTLGIMSGYGSVLRKLHRKREAKAIEQHLKAFAAATHPQ
jgi:tetratricopeptide (TPR) repeat protein